MKRNETQTTEDTMAQETEQFQSTRTMLNNLINVNLDLLDSGDSVKIGEQAERMSKIRDLVSKAIDEGKALLAD